MTKILNNIIIAFLKKGKYVPILYQPIIVNIELNTALININNYYSYYL